MCWGWGWGGEESAALRGKSFQREVVNISWDLPAPRDSSDPVTFQNRGAGESSPLNGGDVEEVVERLWGLGQGPLPANVANVGSNVFLPDHWKTD